MEWKKTPAVANEHQGEPFHLRRGLNLLIVAGLTLSILHRATTVAMVISPISRRLRCAGRNRHNSFVKVLFLHGWQSVPGGVKPTYLV